MRFLPRSLSLVAFFASLVLLGSSAFALDQIKLTTGQTVDGQILNDTSDFADIRLENGIAKRIPHSAIASVQHDIPTLKSNVPPGPPIFFASLNVGGLLLTGHTDADRVLLDYGVRAGFLAGHLGTFQFGYELSYDHASITTTLAEGVFHASGFADFDFQLLFISTAITGFYFGPTIGVLFRSDTIDDVDTGSGGKNLDLGLGVGYAIPINSTFSMGPDLRYSHDFGPTYLNLLKFTFAATAHF